MADDHQSTKRWIAFAGCVLVVGVLHWAQAVLVPVCLAVLITFVLTPPVNWLQRRIGRGAAVLSVVILVFSSLGLAGYGVYRQMTTMSAALPGYRANIRAKILDVRGVKSSGSVQNLETTLAQIQSDLGSQKSPAGTVSQPMVVTTEQIPGFSAISWLGPVLEPLSTGGFVMTLVLFMLLDRADLRDRLYGLFGHGQLAVTTKALDEAGMRVSRQLLLQTVVNVIYGGLALGGLYVLGVPFPLFWGALGASLRFVPYLGPVVAAAGPIVIAMAALPGWTQPIEVAAFYVVLELFTNLVLETVLYAGAAGVSQVALLVAVAFWTWLWGPLGLVLATPLTVCVVVMGKRVPALEFLGTLMSDAPALTVENSFYQRLLAGDQADAADVLDRFVKQHSVEAVYDTLLIPALNHAERDRVEGRLSVDEEAAVTVAAADLLEGLEDATIVAASATPLRVFCYGINGAADELALGMLAQLVRGLPIVLEISRARFMASELVAHVQAEGYRAVCLGDLPPSAASRTRLLVKRLRTAMPDVRIVVGRWACADLADETSEPLVAAGANHVSRTLLETRTYLAEASSVAGVPLAAGPGSLADAQAH
jgi:predicted PurR-regulated permease PerM